jgi:tRNA (guanine-N7-)-methyltransferase
MGRRKLGKFMELQSFPNVYENPDMKQPQLMGLNGQPIASETGMKNCWGKTHFKNENPITLELACGRGEYAVGLGRMYPDRNFIGVDVKGARLHQGAKQAIEEGLSNVAFLRTRIEVIDLFFGENEVSEIWLTFPDPFLRDSKSNRRLTSVPFLDRYRRFLKPNGLVHLKTDSPDLFDFTLKIIADTEGVTLAYADADIYSKPLAINELSIQTYYEKANIARSTIKYLCFRLAGQSNA